MLEIKTTGFQDFLDDQANIRALIIGGPGVGKTRWSSFWPEPLLIDCERNRGSLRDRAMKFAEVHSSKDMLDVLEWAKVQARVPKSQRTVKTLVVDTVDSFQRIVKDEWVAANNAGSFSGYDAWGYLDQKMQLLFTRLLNLDYNVVVLAHYESKNHKDGEDQVREYGLQLQGAIKNQIYNDFGLVGWMGTYWESGPNGREQKRGLTFTPTPDKPFLKDTFGITPSWLPVDLTNANSFQDLLGLFMAELEGGEELPDQQLVESIPDSDAVAQGSVQPPMEGGALPPVPPTEPSDLPLEKWLKPALEEEAKKLGLEVRGNSLKAELVKAIAAKRAEATSSPASPSTPTTPSPENDPWLASSTTGSSTDSSGSKQSGSEQPPTAASPEAAPPPAASDSSEQLVATALGGEVISEEPADAPDKPQPAPPAAQTTTSATSAPQGPSACAGCGTDLAPLWATPEGTQALRKSFVMKRQYLCPNCN